MIYEAILSSSQTDLEFFYALRGKITMENIIYELNYMYKYDETKWVTKRAVRKLEYENCIIYLNEIYLGCDQKEKTKYLQHKRKSR
jgi:hypothetical protein